MVGTKDTIPTVTKANCIRLLQCASQPYLWGKTGSSALVACMKASQYPGYKILEDKPYAELWLGTHPNGMSEVVFEQGKQMSLLDYVRRSPDIHCGMDDSHCNLTFLFKVLSIGKVLSIQAHPGKRLAEQLHTERPEIYKDPNHKPEMAIALEDGFEALVGFRPIEEIQRLVKEYPDFAVLLNDEAKNGLVEAAQLPNLPPRSVLQNVFRSYMETEDVVMQRELKNLLTRLHSKTELNDCDDLILRLAEQFPGDCGIFAPLLFNHLTLKKGEAFFIGANEPHAYIQGEILECMACSDNVVRAGLTPKLKDVETLVNMLTYNSTVPKISTGIELGTYSRAYVPPVNDFCVVLVQVPPGERHELEPVSSPSALLVLEGSGRLEQSDVQCLQVDFGKAAFMSINTGATVVAGDTGLCLARALSNVYLCN